MAKSFKKFRKYYDDDEWGDKEIRQQRRKEKKGEIREKRRKKFSERDSNL